MVLHSHVAAAPLAKEEHAEGGEADDEAEGVGNGEQDHDDTGIQRLLVFLEFGGFDHARPRMLVVARQLPRDGRAGPERQLTVLFGLVIDVLGVVGEVLEGLVDRALLLDLVLRDFEAHVRVASVVRGPELLDGLAVGVVFVVLQRVEGGRGRDRVVLGVQARLVLQLERGQRQVVADGLGGDERVFRVDLVDFVVAGVVLVGGHVGGGHELHEGEGAVGSAGLLHTDGVLGGRRGRALDEFGGAGEGSTTLFAGGLGANGGDEGGTGALSAEAHIEELVLLNRGLHGDIYARFHQSDFPVLSVFVGARGDVAVVFAVGHHHLGGAEASPVLLVHEATLKDAAPLPHEHAFRV